MPRTGKRTPKRVAKTPPKRTKAPARGRRKLLPHGCAFTTEVIEQILAAAENGLPRKYAAESVGVAERTIQRWVERGRDNLDEIDRAEDGDPEAKGAKLDRYGEFVIRLLRAEAKARSEELHTIRSKMGEDWRAAAWYLERVDNRTFGSYGKVEQVTTREDGEQVSAADLLLEKLDQMDERRQDALERARKAGAGSDG